MRSFLFRSTREILFNALRHGDATAVKLELRRAGNEMLLTAKDNGIGFDSALWKAVSEPSRSFGLHNMRERLHQLGGRFEIESQPGSGTCVMIAAPITAPEPGDLD